MAGVPCQGRARCRVPCHRASIVAALALCNAASVSCFAVPSSALAGGLPLFRRPVGLSQGLSERHAPSIWANRRGNQLVLGVSLDRHHNFDIKQEKVRILAGLEPHHLASPTARGRAGTWIGNQQMAKSRGCNKVCMVTRLMLSLTRLWSSGSRWGTSTRNSCGEAAPAGRRSIRPTPKCS